MIGIQLPLRVMAVDRNGHGQPRHRLNLVGCGLGQGTKHIGRDVPAGAGAQIDRRRPGAVQHGALWRLHREGAEAAGIATHIWRKHAFQRIGRVRFRIVQRAVQATLGHLRRRPGEIQLDGIAGHRQLERIGQHLAHGAILHGRGVDAIGQRTDRLPHRGLGAVLHDSSQGLQVVHAVFIHEGNQTLCAQRVRCDHRMDVAQHLPGVADVLRDQGEEVLVRDTGPHQLHRRDLQAFLIDFTGAQGILGAADVGDMADTGHQRDHSTVLKHRRRNGDVEQVASAQPGIVGAQHVARPQRFGRKLLQQCPGGTLHGQVEHRHRTR